jgi:hypothetical protein
LQLRKTRLINKKNETAFFVNIIFIFLILNIVAYPLPANNVFALAMGGLAQGEMKNACRQPMLNKITKVEDKNRSQINNVLPC